MFASHWHAIAILITTNVFVFIFMPRCTVHHRHTVLRSCVGASVRLSRCVGLSNFAYLHERRS